MINDMIPLAADEAADTKGINSNLLRYQIKTKETTMEMIIKKAVKKLIQIIRIGRNSLLVGNTIIMIPYFEMKI